MTDEPVETLEHAGLTIKIYQDEDEQGPREWDNLGTMATFHSRHSLGDEQPKQSAESFEEWLRDQRLCLSRGDWTSPSGHCSVWWPYVPEECLMHVAF